MRKLISMSALIVAVTCLACPILAGAVALELNPDGVADIQQASGEFFAIGGALQSIDNIAGEEYLFGSTGGGAFFPNYLVVEIDSTEVTFATTDQGWVTQTYLHAPSTNYLVGQHIGGEFRNFFIFDLSTLSGTVTSARLELYEHPNVDEYGNSISRHGNYTETLGLFSVETDPSMLNAGVDPAAWADLGSGTNYGEFTFTIITELSTAPVADADGPYSIYIGDTLTLDANDSTDEDDDIVSYMWDLDDDGSFETDAGGQAVFDVNYAYLQSLGLLINYTYTIHLKVTDSEQQSDTADSTLTIVPKPATVVAVDIKPGSCPNPVNVKSSGVLPIAILGTSDYDVTTIDPTSIRLAGVEPLRNSLEDVAAPLPDANDCNCITDGPDGFLDLTLKFKTQRIVEAIGDVNDGDVRVLTLTGVLFDPMPFETPIEGADCILIRGRHKPINPADINKDGVVDAVDFVIIAESWLESSFVGD